MKIVAILPRFPYPLEKGDKLRAFHILKELSTRHEIYLFAISDQPVKEQSIEEIKKFTKEIRIFRQSKPGILLNLMFGFFKGWPFQAGYYYSRAAAKDFHSFVKDVNPGHLLFQLLRTAYYVKAADNIPATLDYMDAFSQNMLRRSKRSFFPANILWKIEYLRLRKFEKGIYSWFENHLIISKQDRQFIDHPDNQNISVVPNGIDYNRFKVKKSELAYNLIFTGNMSYPPNVMACEYIVKKIIPLLKPKYPEIKLALVGTSPKAAVKQLAGPKITVTGWVDDMAQYYSKSQILIAPMQTGAGLQNKILEAMAMGLPVVTSVIAANAMHKQAANTVLTANNPQEYADHIIHLLENPDDRIDLGEKGREYVNRFHNWGNICLTIDKLFEKKD